MSARLVPLKAGAGPTITLQRPVILIGRHPECDVRIDLAQISRRHCCVALAYDRLLIRDLGSRNGVRVNGRLVDEMQLKPGDEVAIGHLLFRLEDNTPGARAAVSAKPVIQAPNPTDIPDLPMAADDDDPDLIPLDDLTID
ncbi:MAG TPA: FHA domain-containing protein [Isosphaeraceae bacterium]|jgi:pSer/pThr/pTyr-binding forkhead associated (FHA) protein|nr:FHA domain-containing protein [Isosphaeraceae bacterium]